MTNMENHPVDNTTIAGFWRRISAFFIDSLILFLVGMAIGWFAFDYLLGLGGWGLLIGFSIALPYFGLMDSRLFYGQTLGKWMMKIKVVQQNGEPLSLSASFVRATIVCVPYFLNGASINISSAQMLVALISSVLVFGIGLTIIYLFIFNRTTRQSLQDIAVGAYVVRVDEKKASLHFGKLWRGHVVVISILIAMSAVVPCLMMFFVNTQPFADMLLLQQGLMKLPDVRDASVFDTVNVNYSSRNGSNSSTTLSMKLWVNSKTVDQTALADQAVQLVFSNYPTAMKKDNIVVWFTYGYDLGIASFRYTGNVFHSVPEWQKRLMLASPPGSTLPK